MSFAKTLVAATTALVALSGTSMAATTYGLDFTVLNDNGQSASASGTVTERKRSVTVDITGSGFDEGVHIGHFHGFNTPAYKDANTPSPAADTDGDGFIELGEGGAVYGPIIVPFDAVNVGSDGMYRLMQTFLKADFPDLITADYKLEDREVVLHGLFTNRVRVDEIGTPEQALGGGVTGEFAEANYNIALPFMSSEVMPTGDGVSDVPLPAAAWMLLAGLGGLGAVARRRRG